MLNKFADEAAHIAAAKLTTESGVDLIESSNEVVTDGANVVSKNPKVGDILVLDENNKKRFIALDTFKAAVFPSSWTIVGVVAYRKGNRVMIVHKANAGKKWADVFRWYLTGSTMTDGASHTQNFTADGVSVSVTWQTSTLSDFATALNNAISGQSFNGHTYRALYDAGEDKVFVIHDTYTAWKEPSMSGITFNRYIGESLVPNSTAYRKNQVSLYWGVVNLKRAVAYYSASGSTPSANVPVRITTGDAPVKYSEFVSNAYCADIRNAYCVNPNAPTMDDYTKYVYEEFFVEYPSARASMSEEFRDGKKNTYALVGATYLASDNTQKPLYPAAEYCAAVGYNSEGLEAGNWFLPSKHEMFPLWSQLTYGLAGVTRDKADPVNRSLYAIAGSAISCTSNAWSSAMYGSGSAWYYNGNGVFNSGDFCYALAAVPCVLLNLSESED